MRIITVALVLAVATPFHVNAQWKWRDAQGVIHYSDRPPPVETPERDILRAGQKSEGSRSTPTPGTPPAGKPDQTPVDRNDWRALAEQMRKRDELRRAGQAEQDRKARQADELQRACETLRAELRTLESGMRIASVGEDGERQVLDETRRRQRIEQLRTDLERHCAER
jgi:hypothetical protein